MKPNVTLSILSLEAYGNNTYPCELTVRWPSYDVYAVVCGYVDTDCKGNFDPNTFTYGQSLSDSRLSDNDDWHADWGIFT